MSAIAETAVRAHVPAQAADLRAEFDLLADEYNAMHRANVAITGEAPEFFAEYKIADLARLAAHSVRPVRDIVDFGSGIGNSIPWFRKYFPQARLVCADVSARSHEIASTRFPGAQRHLLVQDRVPVPPASCDLVFSACVFHHIPHAQHLHWLRELRRIVRPGGLLVIYEHNPANPLTVHAVRTCPLDANAHLVRPAQLAHYAARAGWRAPAVDYKLFFPHCLRMLRPLEPALQWLPLGAQYRLVARQRV
jgi:SAM-dependent methyltransferase